VLLLALGCWQEGGGAFVHGKANEPIEDNILGQVARRCSQEQCVGSKDSLTLWLSLSPVCQAPADSADSFEMLASEGASLPLQQGAYWSAEAAIILCAVWSILCGLGGLHVGKMVMANKKKHKRPTLEL
jgi:hypothetical protein